MVPAKMSPKNIFKIIYQNLSLSPFHRHHRCQRNTNKTDLTNDRLFCCKWPLTCFLFPYSIYYCCLWQIVRRTVYLYIFFPLCSLIVVFSAYRWQKEQKKLHGCHMSIWVQKRSSKSFILLALVKILLGASGKRDAKSWFCS